VPVRGARRLPVETSVASVSGIRFPPHFPFATSHSGSPATRICTAAGSSGSGSGLRTRSPRRT